MKVVLDTNVLVAAAISWSRGRASDSRWLVQVAFMAQRRYEHVTSDPLMYELQDVLNRREHIDAVFARRFVDDVSLASTFTKVHGLAMGVRDWRDDRVVETAMNANADAIISQDLDLHDARARYSIGKTGIGIRSRPIAVWDVGTFLAVLNGSPRFSPLVVATLAA
jgi:putative PIN family toxin of toxin-antitoxin system